jgi:hypothetical protein
VLRRGRSNGAACAALGGLEIDHELEFGRLLDRQIGRGAFANGSARSAAR